jgi:hypothetical protein
MKSDDEIAAEAVRLLPIYLRRIGRIRRRSLKRAVYAAALCLFAATLYLTYVSSARPPGMPNLSPLTAAVALVCVFGGAGAGWIVAAISSLWVAWALSPSGTLWVDAEWLPWFVEHSLTWVAVRQFCT